jgi:hypothetical protein
MTKYKKYRSIVFAIFISFLMLFASITVFSQEGDYPRVPLIVLADSNVWRSSTIPRNLNTVARRLPGRTEVSGHEVFLVKWEMDLNI